MNMMLLGDIIFGDKEAFTVFMGEHEIAHNGITQAFENMFGYAPATTPLGDSEGDSDWLINHYRVHQNLSATLGLTGLPDLSDVDLSVETEFNDWIQSHNFEHAKLNAALNLL